MRYRDEAREDSRPDVPIQVSQLRTDREGVTKGRDRRSIGREPGIAGAENKEERRDESAPYRRYRQHRSPDDHRGRSAPDTLPETAGNKPGRSAGNDVVTYEHSHRTNPIGYGKPRDKSGISDAQVAISPDDSRRSRMSQVCRRLISHPYLYGHSIPLEGSGATPGR